MEPFLRVVLLLLASFTIGATVWLGSIDKEGAAGITATLSIGILLFLYLTRFKRFKGLGFEGELWEQELEKAAEIQRRLRELAQQIGESVYWQLGPGSRISGGTPEAIFGMVRRTDQTLAAIGIDANRIEKLKCPWHKCVMHDLARPIRKAFGDILLRKADELKAEMSALGSPITPGNKPRFDELHKIRQQIIKEQKSLTDAIWRDDFESVPQLLRGTIDQNQWLSDEERKALYSEFAQCFVDIDKYAREKDAGHPVALDTMVLR